jgi:tape measure domain-containing protein
MRGGFEAMLGSADKAKKLLTDLSEYNKKTPFELPDLQEQAGNLLAIGVAVDDLIPTMDTLGKISRGNSQRFGFLALAFGQVKTATKLTGAELRQFTENGVPLLELLAQQTGKTTAQMREDISDGAVSFDMVDKALKSTVQEGGRFYNYFERNSNNFSYVLSNLKDSAMQMGRSILGISESGDILNGSIADLSMQGLQNLLTFVNNNKEAIIDFVKNGIQVGINAFNDFRLNVLPGIILKLQELQAWWQGEGGQAVRDFVSNVWNKVVEGFEKLKNDVIPPLLTEISKISDKFKEITKWYEDNKAWVDNLAILLGGIAAGFALVSLALGVYAVVIGIATAVSTAFAAVMAFIASPFFLIALAIGVVIAIGVLLWKNWDWLGQQAQNIWNFISSVFMSAMSAIGTFFSNFWVWLTVSPQEWGYRIGFLIGSVIKFFIDSWNAVFAFSNWLWAMIVDFAIRSFVGLVAFIINFPNLIKFYFEIAKHWAISTFIQIAIWAINKFNEIKKTITDTFEAIKKIDLLEVGKNVIDGLIKGITSMQNKVNETVKGVADGVAKGFKDALQIKSPSRVMMEAGVNVGEGVSIGIEKSLPMIAQSSNNMATETVQPMQNVTTTINNQKTYNQNIYGSGGGAGFLNLANQY